MATYQLSKFFDEFFREMHTAPPETYRAFLSRAEAEFVRAGWREKISTGVENILIVHFSVIGDVIWSSVFLREVRKNFPRARITLVVLPHIYPLVELCPYVNEVLVFDIKSIGDTIPEKLERIVTFCRENLWRRNFSIAFSPWWHRGDKMLDVMFFMWLSGARERIGFGLEPVAHWFGKVDPQITELENFFLTKCILTPQSAVSDIEKILHMLEALGLTVDETHTEIFFGAADVLRARALLKDIPPTCKKVLLGLGGSEMRKKYPAEKYLLALRELLKKNLFFVMLGGQSELEDAAYVEKNLPPEKILNLVGKTTLRESEAIAAQMDYYVGNDTGMAHMAAAAQIPCLVLYRDAQDKENFFPGYYGAYSRCPPWQTKFVALRPDHQLGDCADLPPIHGWCHHRNEPHCITQITPQEIVAGFEALEEL